MSIARPLLSIASVVSPLAPAVFAQVTCYSDHAAWVAAAGPATASEDFESFVADQGFEAAPVALAVGSIGVSSGGVGFRNRIEVPPFVYGDNNGTSHASCFTNYDEPTNVRITLAQPASAIGFNVYDAIGGSGEGMVAHLLSGGVSIGSCQPAGPGAQFVGFVATTAFDAVEMRSINWNVGSGGEGFGLDDIEVVSGCPAGSGYCTPGTTSGGCLATISGTGTPSTTSGSGYQLVVNNVEGQRSGLIFYGISGQQAVPWGFGGSSFLCVKPPTQRGLTQNSGGTLFVCNGALSMDWNAFVATPGVLAFGAPAGTIIQAQGWFRDPPSVKSTSLSNAWEFRVCP
jgi:hypothetical protein